MTETYEGGCHCGRVRFCVRVDVFEATDCNCSVCAKKGFLHLIVTKDAFEMISIPRHTYDRYRVGRRGRGAGVIAFKASSHATTTAWFDLLSN